MCAECIKDEKAFAGLPPLTGELLAEILGESAKDIFALLDETPKKKD